MTFPCKVNLHVCRETLDPYHELRVEWAGQAARDTLGPKPDRSRANTAQIRQSGPYHGLVLQVRVVKIFKVFPLGSAAGGFDCLICECCSTFAPVARPMSPPRSCLQSGQSRRRVTPEQAARVRCRANMAHTRQARPNSGLVLQVKFVGTF